MTSGNGFVSLNYICARGTLLKEQGSSKTEKMI